MNKEKRKKKVRKKKGREKNRWKDNDKESKYQNCMKITFLFRSITCYDAIRVAYENCSLALR